MIETSIQLRNLIESRNFSIVPVVEIYDRSQIEIATLSSPGNALARFSDRCFVWENSTGSYEYSAKIESFPSVKTFLDDRQNEAEITLSNVKRGADSGASFVLNNKIKGTWMVIRLIFPDLMDESWVIWWGKCLRPGKIDSKIVSLAATQEIGNYKVKIPFRSYSVKCPLTPGKDDCMGNETLDQKSELYRPKARGITSLESD